MTLKTIRRLEPLPTFVGHAVELNRAICPDDTLALIHRDYPEWPIHEQAAYLVRAFGGLRPFAEGNHRTGWAVTANLLAHHGHELLASDQEGRVLGNDVWQQVETQWPDGMPRRAVADRDALFSYLAHWFLHRVA